MIFLDFSDADPHTGDHPHPALLFEVYPVPPVADATRESVDGRLLLETARRAGVEGDRYPLRPSAFAPLLTELKRCTRLLQAWHLRKSHP